MRFPFQLEYKWGNHHTQGAAPVAGADFRQAPDAARVVREAQADLLLGFPGRNREPVGIPRVHAASGKAHVPGPGIPLPLGAFDH